MANNKNKKKPVDIRLVLDNIRSTHNVGSIFRTAETLGISRIYCVGTTPTPIDRFGRARADIAKVALGAEKLVSWEHYEDTYSCVEDLLSQGFQTIALEQSDRSVDYKEIDISDKTVIILGNEVSGIAKDVLRKVDIVAEIPMAGSKESLNVSVAAGVALFRLLDR